MTFGNLHDDPYCIALAAQMTERLAANPYDAEIVPGCRPKWHVVVTHPSREITASAHLIARRFGVYLPEFDRQSFVRGHSRNEHLTMFPGYLFIFVWDIMAHWRRIRACTGVGRILLDGAWPAVAPDHVIDAIQKLELNLLLNGPNTPLKKIPRYNRKGWGSRDESTPEEVAGIFTKSYFRDLDGEERNHLLHRALGLAS